MAAETFAHAFGWGEVKGGDRDIGKLWREGYCDERVQERLRDRTSEILRDRTSERDYARERDRRERREIEPARDRGFC